MGTKKTPVTECDSLLVDVIKEQMKLRGVTQSALIKASGISQTRMSNILNKQKAFTWANVYDIAHALGIKASLLIQLTEDREAEESRENVPASKQNVTENTSAVEDFLAHLDVAAYTIGERDGELEYP